MNGILISRTRRRQFRKRLASSGKEYGKSAPDVRKSGFTPTVIRAKLVFRIIRARAKLLEVERNIRLQGHKTH